MSNQLLQNICRGKLAAQKFFGQVWGNSGKIDNIAMVSPVKSGY